MVPGRAAGATLEMHRGDRIRTCDLLVPNQALYQAKLHPALRTPLWRTGREKQGAYRGGLEWPHSPHLPKPGMRNRCRKVAQGRQRQDERLFQ